MMEFVLDVGLHLTASYGCMQERVGTVEKQKNDLMMQQAMMQQQGESLHMMQGPMLGAPFGPGENGGAECL